VAPGFVEGLAALEGDPGHKVGRLVCTGNGVKGLDGLLVPAEVVESVCPPKQFICGVRGGSEPAECKLSQALVSLLRHRRGGVGEPEAPQFLYRFLLFAESFTAAGNLVDGGDGVAS